MAKSLLSQQNQEQHLPCLPWGSVRTTPAPQSQVLARSKSAPWVRGSLLLTLQVLRSLQAAWRKQGQPFVDTHQYSAVNKSHF